MAYAPKDIFSPKNPTEPLTFSVIISDDPNMIFVFVLACSILVPSISLTLDDAKTCNAGVPPIDFLVLEGDANAEAIEDEVRQDLEKLGFTVQSRFLAKNDFNQARAKGEFGLSFSETW